MDELEDFNILCYRGKNFREDSLCNDLDFLKAFDGFIRNLKISQKTKKIPIFFETKTKNEFLTCWSKK